MSRPQVTISVPPDAVDVLDRMVAAEGGTRADAIVRLVGIGKHVWKIAVEDRDTLIHRCQDGTTRVISIPTDAPPQGPTP